MSPITRNEKSPRAGSAGGCTANASAPLPTGCDAETARTIASRQVSVRASAQEFQTPAAQFSVSKYQLMPQTGTVAAITAEAGRPIRSPRRTAVGAE